MYTFNGFYESNFCYFYHVSIKLLFFNLLACIRLYEIKVICLSMFALKGDI